MNEQEQPKRRRIKTKTILLFLILGALVLIIHLYWTYMNRQADVEDREMVQKKIDSLFQEDAYKRKQYAKLKAERDSLKVITDNKVENDEKQIEEKYVVVKEKILTLEPSGKVEYLSKRLNGK